MELFNAIWEVAPGIPEQLAPHGSALRFMETVKLCYETAKWSHGSDGEITTELHCVKGQ